MTSKRLLWAPVACSPIGPAPASRMLSPLGGTPMSCRAACPSPAAAAPPARRPRPPPRAPARASARKTLAPCAAGRLTGSTAREPGGRSTCCRVAAVSQRCLVRLHGASIAPNALSTGCPSGALIAQASCSFADAALPPCNITYTCNQTPRTASCTAMPVNALPGYTVTEFGGLTYPQYLKSLCGVRCMPPAQVAVNSHPGSCFALNSVAAGEALQEPRVPASLSCALPQRNCSTRALSRTLPSARR